MYKEYFGLRDIPFSIAPDPRYLYMSEGHREALAHLVYGINSDGGFVLLTGEVGTGKTTVCRCLLEQIPADTNIAFILNPKLTAEELLAACCDELGIRYPAGNTSIKVFVDCINAYLLEAHTKGRRTVLIIEEAQNLSANVLEQVRLLTNLETNQRKLLQIIMLGQPELQDMLLQPELRQLSQRITARYHLGPLSEKDVAAYVAHRLAVAGAHARLFPPDTIRQLFRISGGIPRLINVLCDRALLGTYVQGRDRVDKSTLSKAAAEVLGGNSLQLKYGKRMGWVFAGLLVLICAAALAATYYNRAAPSPPKKAEHLQGHPADVLQWPAGQPQELSRELAFGALLKQWNLTYQSGVAENACAQAEQHGLRCLNRQGSLNSLVLLNRPAVLRLTDDTGKEFSATLVHLENNSASFVLGNETRTVDIREIPQHWSGDYTLLWKVPPHYQGEIRPGDERPAVQWLRRQLSIIRNEKPHQPGSDVFDQVLVRQVKDFQNSEGLIPDGIVGPETIIHLDTAAGSQVPLLARLKKEK